MKCLNIRISVSLILLFMICKVAISQDNITVTVDKPGRLSKVIKRGQAKSIISLEINGIMNSDDFAYLKEFESLEKLYIFDVKLTNDKEKNYHNYVSRFPLSITVPELENLKELAIPVECICFNLEASLSLDKLILPSTCDITASVGSLKVKNAYIKVVNGEEKKAKFKEKPGEKNFFTRSYWVKRSKTDYSTSYIQGGYRIPIDTLYVNSASQLQNIAASKFDPCYILIEPYQQLILNKYPENGGGLEKVNLILEGAFLNSNLKEITIPSSIRAIPDYCFAGCKNLQSVTLSDSIFYIGKSAFAGTGISNLVLPSKLQYICYDAFEDCNLQVCKIQSSNPPQVLVSSAGGNLNSDMVKQWGDNWNECVIRIPQGTFENYRKDEIWRTLSLSEEGSKRSFNITIPKPGTILSYLSMSTLPTIDSLAITGFLYDTDMEVLKKCISLKYIDISHTFITESPETKRRNQQQWQEFSAYVQLMGGAADIAYKENQISTMEYLATKGLAELSKSASNFKEADENCFVPNKIFTGMKHLRTAKLPLRAVSIGHMAFSGCSNLETVELPPYVKVFGEKAFENCVKLKIDKFPSSITKFYDKVFFNCISLDNIDLSACTINGDFDMSIFALCRINKLKLPNGIETVDGGTINGVIKDYNCSVINTIYFPKTLKNIKTSFYNQCNLYFKTENPPVNRFSYVRYPIENCTFYVPRDCTTAYYSAFGDSNTYKEE